MGSLILLLLAQVSSPMGEGVCLPMFAAVGSSERGEVMELLEGVGAYCSLSGCRLTGPLKIAVNGNTLRLGVGSTAARTICFDAESCAQTLTYSSVGGFVFSSGIQTGYVTAIGSITSASGGHITSADYTSTATYFKSTGVATGSLPTCNAGQAGSLEWDTTRLEWARCNGATWSRVFTTQTSIPFTSSHYCGTGVCSNSTAFGSPTNFTPWDADSALSLIATQRVACNWGTAGVGGTTGVVVQVWDLTTASEVCSCTVGACTAAASADLSCVCGPIIIGTPSHNFTVRLKSTTDCATNPQFVSCGVVWSYTRQ